MSRCRHAGEQAVVGPPRHGRVPAVDTTSNTRAALKASTKSEVRKISLTPIILALSPVAEGPAVPGPGALLLALRHLPHVVVALVVAGVVPVPSPQLGVAPWQGTACRHIVTSSCVALDCDTHPRCWMGSKCCLPPATSARRCPT